MRRAIAPPCRADWHSLPADAAPRASTAAVAAACADRGGRAGPELFNEAVLIFSNAARRQHGRPPLRQDPGLSRAAADHALNMARLRTHSHVLPVRGQGKLAQRMRRQSLEFRMAAENIAMDKVYRLLGRPIAIGSQGCRFTYGDTGSRCRSTPTPASPSKWWRAGSPRPSTAPRCSRRASGG